MARSSGWRSANRATTLGAHELHGPYHWRYGAVMAWDAGLVFSKRSFTRTIERAQCREVLQQFSQLWGSIQSNLCFQIPGDHANMISHVCKEWSRVHELGYPNQKAKLEQSRAIRNMRD